MSDRKRAIETLKQLRLDYEEFYEEHNNEVTQAYDMAIASLETDEAYDLEYEQPKFCKDCISREAVYYYISSHINEIITESGTDKNAHTNAILRSLANGVKLMPSVLPDVPDNNVGKIGSTTKNDLGVDAISRAEMLKYQQYLHGKMSNEENHKLWEFIKELPSATPIRPKGHWITRPHVYGVTYCSKCDFELKIDNTNYCPNCGAKMVEPQESEDNK